jgi:hypothetical protein
MAYLFFANKGFCHRHLIDNPPPPHCQLQSADTHTEPDTLVINFLAHYCRVHLISYIIHRSLKSGSSDTLYTVQAV